MKWSSPCRREVENSQEIEAEGRHCSSPSSSIFPALLLGHNQLLLSSALHISPYMNFFFLTFSFSPLTDFTLDGHFSFLSPLIFFTLSLQVYHLIVHWFIMHKQTSIVLWLFLTVLGLQKTSAHFQSLMNRISSSLTCWSSPQLLHLQRQAVLVCEGHRLKPEPHHLPKNRQFPVERGACAMNSNPTVSSAMSKWIIVGSHFTVPSKGQSHMLF